MYSFVIIMLLFAFLTVIAELHVHVSYLIFQNHFPHAQLGPCMVRVYFRHSKISFLAKWVIGFWAYFIQNPILKKIGFWFLDRISKLPNSKKIIEFTIIISKKIILELEFAHFAVR